MSGRRHLERVLTIFRDQYWILNLIYCSLMNQMLILVTVWAIDDKIQVWSDTLNNWRNYQKTGIYLPTEDLEILPNQTPGTVKSGKFGQLPSSPGSPPIRTKELLDGVGPSRMKSWNQPGGEVHWSGGAVIVHWLPWQVKAGKIVRWPKLFPWVLEMRPIKDIFRFATLPAVTVMV